MKPVEFDAELTPDRTLRIPEPLAGGLPPSGRVRVRITQTPTPPLDVAAAIKATFGSCADPSLDAIFRTIDDERHRDTGRPVQVM
ncbi:MAG: hypothetical protein ACREIT_00220 [Tepidisphaeraceae bacterium]